LPFSCIPRIRKVKKRKRIFLVESEAKLAFGALASLINYLELMSMESNFGHFSLERFDLTKSMRLDSAAVKALNLMPSASDGSDFLIFHFCLP